MSGRAVIRLEAGSSPDLRLYCFPYAGAGTLVFRDWPRLMPSPVEVWAIRLPGRESRIQEDPLVRIAAMATAVASELLTSFDKPFAFFGHSMGALLCFEVARLMRDCGEPSPRALFLSGRSAPHIPFTSRCTYDLPDAEFLRELKALNGTPAILFSQPDILNTLLPVLRADFEACQTYHYVPGLPLDCPIHVFGGLADAGVPRSDLQEWSKYTSARFSIGMLPGDHFFLTTFQRELTRRIAEFLFTE